MSRIADDWDHPGWEHRRRRNPQSFETVYDRWEDEDHSARRLVNAYVSENPGRRKYDGPAYGPRHVADHELADVDRGDGGKPEYAGLVPAQRPFEKSYTLLPDTHVSGGAWENLPSHNASAEPFFDFRILLSAIVRSWKLILFLMIAGMVLIGFATTIVPSKYTANTSLYFDPARLTIAWEGQNGSSSNTQSAGALINSQIEVLVSSVVLREVVGKLSLENDPEFAGGADGDEAVVQAAGALREAIGIGRVGDSYVVSLNATTGDPVKSADIANAVVEAFMNYEDTAATDSYLNFTSNLDQRLEVLRNKAFAAEKAVEDYRAKNDLVTAGGVLISDERLAALNTALVQAEQKTIEARAKADAASRLSLESAVAGANDAEVSSSSLLQLRRQFSTASAELDRLRISLGARHPSLAAAEASLAGIRREIDQELKRIASTAQTELSQAEKAQDEIASELAAQKALKLSNSPYQAELDNLELQAATTRSIYETVLRRTRQTNEELENAFTNVRVLGKAEPPLTADGPGRKMLLLGGIVGGAMLGFGLGLVIAIVIRLFQNPVVRSYVASAAR
ncbi:GumC family protein [Roseibium sp. MMSF_3544]|uniref:GumC family protein n=1 Tax=unclassified Roseibium TaxID=2629323 RepID=UPI00273E12AE|nr:GumC family protein [Roseibium sp. MMSF_3544]